MSKRILSLVLTLALVLGSFSMAFADTAVTTSAKVAKDVEGTQYEKAVATLEKLKVLEGYPDATFRPGNTITRAEFAAVVSRITGLETAAQNAKGKTIFTDVTADNWASGYINVAEKGGLINGVGNGRFAPESKITYEQAITMIVRALGYEHEAQRLGGYPVGYLSVASRADSATGVSLLKDIPASEGSQGVPATRGLVALLLNNSLEIRKMVQVGFGDQARWVVSGTVDNSQPVYLFEDLGLKQIEKAVVTKADNKKQSVVLEQEYEKGKFRRVGLKADKDFDYVGLQGMRVTAWYDDKKEELIVAKEDGAFKAKYDVVEKDGSKIKLVNEKEKYDLAKERVLRLNDESVSLDGLTENNNTYAKVIVNEYGEVNYVDAYSLNDTIVVKEVSKDLIKGYDRREISDSKDYTIIKNGKQISAADLKDKDYVIYNSKAEVAVVITDVREGKLDTVYKEGFKFEGKTYDNDTAKYGDIKYIVESDLESINQDVLEEMQDNGEVKIYFSFDNKPLFIDGEAKEIVSNYVMLESNSVSYENRGTQYRTFDVLNSEGKVIKYEVKESDINSSTNKIFEEGNLNDWKTAFENAVVKDAKGEVTDTVVAKITTDAAGKLTKVKSMAKKTISLDVATDDTYLGGARLQSNTVVFMKDGENKVKDYSAIKWSDAGKEFKKVTVGDYYIFEDKVVAIYAKTTDGDTQTKEVVGVLKKSKERTSRSRYDVIVELDGKEVSFEAKGTVSNIANLEDSVNKVVVLTVTKEGNELRGYSVPTGTKVTVKSATSGRLTDSNNKNYEVEGQYYNNSLKNTIKAGDVEGKDVTLYFQPGSGYYVQVVQLGEGSNSPSGDTLKYAYSKGGTIFLTINGKDYEYGGVKTLAQLKGLEDKVVDFEVRNEVVVSIEAKDVTPEPTPVDKTALNTAITTAKTKVNDTQYTQTSRDALKAAITAAEAVVANTKATQAEVDAAKQAIDKVELVKETPGGEKVTAEAEFVLNPIVKKYVLRVKLSDNTKTVEKFIIDGVETDVHSVQDGYTVSKGTFEAKASVVEVVVDGKPVPATIK